jgi:hypothetical protein
VSFRLKENNRKMTTQQSQPVFVVGCPRSGTTMLAALLGAHSRLACGPETEFFTDLPVAHRYKRLCRAANWPHEAANYLFSRIHERPIPDDYGITRAEIITFLKRRERSLPAILESLTETYMHRQGKQRWIEKTPTHLIRTHQIRRCYPEAPIIRILRDPRDTALSLFNVPWFPFSFAAAVLHWRYFDEESARFFETDRNATTVRFEDLVSDPEGELRKLCRFIGEEFEPGMIDTSRSVKHVNPTDFTWLQKAGQPPDPNRIAVWRRESTSEQQHQAEAFVGNRLRAYGYPISFEFKRYIQILNLATLAEFPVLLNHFLDGDTRFWRASPREAPRVKLFLGDPCAQGWIGGWRTARLAKVFEVGKSAAHSRLTGVPLTWVGAPTPDQIQRWGFLCHVLARFLPKPLDVDAFCKGQCQPTSQQQSLQRSS